MTPASTCRLSSLVALVPLALLSACGLEPRSLPSAVNGLQASATLASQDQSDAALLVGNLTNPAPHAGNGILRYNAGTGAFVDAIVPEGSGPAGNPLLGPCCMVFGPDENLYVSNLLGAALTDRGVFRYNGVTGEFMDVFVSGNSGGLRRPLILLFGPDGNLYVGDAGGLAQGGTAIRRYNGHTGAFVDVFVAPGSGGMATGDPQFFVFGPDGNLYVASQATHRILRFNGTTGAFIDAFVSAGAGGLSAPSGLIFGPDGNLYVGSTTSNTVLRYDGTTGAFIDVFVPAGSGGLTVPVGLTFGPDGDLYVASAENNGNGSVLRYGGRSGAFLDAFVPTGSGGISGPRGLLFKEKITICHRPPGNPYKAKTISIGYLSAQDHLARGDVVGACP
jgi:DNA-binding beta-propeller fold protein YncE